MTNAIDTALIVNIGQISVSETVHKGTSPRLLLQQNNKMMHSFIGMRLTYFIRNNVDRLIQLNSKT